MARFDTLSSLLYRYRELGIDTQIDYEKFYLYSIITHSTAIEGSTVTEMENQLLFDEGISVNGKPIIEQMMNLDLKRAYEESMRLAAKHVPFSLDMLKGLSAMVMRNTGSTYKTAMGEFSSANGDLRLLNVSAGVGGKSYLGFQKVPAKLQEFCEWLNAERQKQMSDIEWYRLSFEAHYRLVTIHPWADGNGRMARLVMNHLQFEYGLVPVKVLKEDKSAYINALIRTRESENINVFIDFMVDEAIKTLSAEIDSYLESGGEGSKKKQKSRDRIVSILREHPDYSSTKLAKEIGISSKGIEKQLANLKSEGILRREGPDKGGRWIVL